MTLKMRGKQYRLRSYDELSGGDWRQLTLELERAADDPGEFLNAMRAEIQILAPSAHRQIRKCDDVELILAGAAAQAHVGQALRDALAVMTNLSRATSIIQARIQAARELASGESK